MKRFDFSLQKVLDFRDFQKKQAEAELGKAAGEEAKIERTLKMVAESRVKTIREADEMKNINDLYNAQLYFRLLDQRRDALNEELARAKIVTEEKRTVMREAMKKSKVLENLRDHRKEAWKKEQLKIEDDAIDDIVTGLYSNSVSNPKIEKR